MQLNIQQEKIVHNKHLGYSIIKGNNLSGKTTAAVYRSFYLKSNYCLYNSDNILIITDNDKNTELIEQMYNKIDIEAKLDYITLFSMSNPTKSRVESINSIIHKYYIEYRKENQLKQCTLVNKQEIREIVAQSLIELQKQYTDVKIMDEKYIEFLIDEIKWIKSCNYRSVDLYQNADRLGRIIKDKKGPRRLLKNSRQREAIFELLLTYNSTLKEKNYIDEEDKVLMAIEQAKYLNSNYTHVIIDGCENLTRLQLEFVKALKSSKTYWSMMFVIGGNSTNDNAWFAKGRKVNSLELESKTRNYLLKYKYEENNNCERYKKDEGITMTIDRDKENINTLSSIEDFQYCDLKHRKEYDFFRDINNSSEIIVRDNMDKEYEYTSEELMQIPVYSDIAAGEPILINPNMEDSFYIPGYWLKGMKDCFILKVKGDSMINANIYHGDYVVIRKQYVAQNNDIVAVNLDGSATLKRLSMSKNKVLLMPENEKYDPIPITEEGTSIIGVAVGIIKHK